MVTGCDHLQVIGPVLIGPQDCACEAPLNGDELMKIRFVALTLAFAANAALAAPAIFKIDPNHTYPSFEADHMGGLSVWRGKFRSSSGTVTLDTEGHSGDVDVAVDPSSIDFGLEKLNEQAKSAEMFDVAKYPTATYKGKLVNFKNDAPT